jgi:hypothetical protein
VTKIVNGRRTLGQALRRHSTAGDLNDRVGLRSFISASCLVVMYASVITIGKPYAGEPQVRFDEGGQDCSLWMILNGHEAGNSALTNVEPVLYSTVAPCELPMNPPPLALRNVPT